MPVRLYERDIGESSSSGAAELTANGSRVLHALGLKQALAEAAIVPDFTTIRSAATGFLLSQRPLGQFSEARYGAPCYLVDGCALTAFLRLACLDADIPVEHGVEIADVKTESGTLVTDDGTYHTHLATAIATGNPNERGALLDRLLEPRPQTQAEITVIQARIQRTRPTRDHGRFINTWLFPGGYCVERPLPGTPPDQQQVDVLMINRSPQPDLPPEAELVRLLEGTHAALRDLLSDTLTAEYLDCAVTAPADHWHTGRMALLGGICHAPPAYADFGPNAALEDAWVLSRMMERWEEEPYQELGEFERFRKPRAWRLRANADADLATLTLDHPAAIWRRNLKWSLTSRFLPEITMEKLDWLYGYDCIGGFA